MGRKYNGEKDKKSKELADIPGEQICKQYYNVPMYIFAGAAYFFICCGIFLPIGGGEWSSALAFAVSGLLIAVLICGPFALLSAWNRKKFGKLICVLDDKGLYYRDRVISGMRYVYETRFIPWTDIMSMKYRVPVGLRPNRVTVYCHSSVTHTIDHAPRYLFVRAKKYKPALITTDALAAWVAVVGIPVLAAVMSFVVPNLNK